ncbi:CwfJ C-terminus 1-domain-containing protein-like protein [Umbelopsis sp. PMI_123]|nr:CwfJ C-terminus 1-domain-containing protein-like protein [Umbelopsis sp. PMI_123]
MGSDRKESKRSKKSRSEHKSHKKHKKHHRSIHEDDDASLSEPEIDYNDPSLWTAEKTIEGIAPVTNNPTSVATAIAPTAVETAPVAVEANSNTESARDSWMTDASLDFSSFGAVKQKQPKEEKPNPDQLHVSSREINPHFKAGLHIDQYPEQAKPTYKFGDAGSKWRMTKLRRTMEQAEDEGRPLEEVALEKYGSMEKFEEAMSEKRALEGRKSRRGDDDGRSRDRGSRHDNHPRMMFSDASSSREMFKKPQAQTSSRDNADVDEFGRSRRKRSRSPTNVEHQTKLAKAVSSSAAPTPSRPIIISQHSNPSLFSDKPPLSVDELNKLNAKVVKARLMGAPNLEELEKEYEKEKKRADEYGTTKDPSVAVVPTVDSQGRLHEFALSNTSTFPSDGPQRKRKEKFEGTHDSKTGERLKYGSNDDKVSLDDLVRQEKAGTRSATDMDMDLANRIAGDVTFEDDLDYMDEQAEKMATKKEKTEESKIRHAINDHKRSQQALDSCRWCYQDGKPPQCAMISLGTKTYLALPNVTDLVPGHCFIVPLQHAISSLECDDDVWDEIRNFQKCLMRMFHEQGKGVVFMELVKNLKYQRHTVIECIPVPYGTVEDAPMYFQEAIKNSEGEWSQHKKLIDTSKRGFRRSMVKNLPYFHVWFSPDQGYGHVIEEEKEFPPWFGKEVVAGMMDLPPHLWRKPRYQHQSDNRERQKAFIQQWQKYDWTAALEGGEFEQ